MCKDVKKENENLLPQVGTSHLDLQTLLGMRLANVYNLIQRLVEHVNLRPKPEDPRCVDILHISLTVDRGSGCLKPLGLQLEFHFALLKVLFPLELRMSVCFHIQKV